VLAVYWCLSEWLNADLGFIDDTDVYDGSHLAFINDKNVYYGGCFHNGNAVLQFAPTKKCSFHNAQKRYRSAHKIGGPKMPAKARTNSLLHLLFPEANGTTQLWWHWGCWGCATTSTTGL
jgi:hypothetical protein